MTTIPLGYEVGTGRAISIPRDHMVVTGRTQASGKTTALEALVTRAGVRGIAFIVKKGERSFRIAKPIAPYFCEPQDTDETPLWQWVKSILEATMQTKMGMKESWIIRAAEGARTLADVHRNIKERLKKEKRGFSADMYKCLDAYFSIVMPQLERLPYTSKLELQPGLNVMDLTGYTEELAALVIRSVLEWVYRREKNTVVVVPEAWKFMPRERNSPVRLMAEKFVRECAVRGDYLWIDSQDLAGIHTAVLKQVGVWLVGVQREANEVARVMKQFISVPARPKPDEIMTLGLGQFYACWAGQRFKTYVQPIGLSPEHARAVAVGDESVDNVPGILREIDLAAKRVAAPFRSAGIPAGKDSADVAAAPVRAAQSQSRLEAGATTVSVAADVISDCDITDDGKSASPSTNQRTAGLEGQSAAATESSSEEAMYKEKYEKLKADYDTLIKKVYFYAQPSTSELLNVSGPEMPGGGSGGDRGNASPIAQKAENGETGVTGASDRRRSSAFDETMPVSRYLLGEVYDYVRQRALQDRSILELLAQKPELRVKVSRPVLVLDHSTLKGRLAGMIAEGFFAEPKTGSAAYSELATRRKFRTSKPNVYRECDALANLGFLVSTEAGYCAVAEMRVKIEEA